MHPSRGFTLIELMIVVAILAILAAIAIPQYQNFIVRTQLIRGVAEINQLRKAVEICEADGNTQEGCVADTIDSDMLITTPEVTFVPGSIRAVFGRNASSLITGDTIRMDRQEDGSWVCSLTTSRVNESLYPRGCMASE